MCAHRLISRRSHKIRSFREKKKRRNHVDLLVSQAIRTEKHSATFHEMIIKFSPYSCSFFSFFLMLSCCIIAEYARLLAKCNLFISIKCSICYKSFCLTAAHIPGPRPIGSRISAKRILFVSIKANICFLNLAII